jgi:hypothetical protein
MVSESKRLYLPGADDFDVACALAMLAGFPRGSYPSRCNNIYRRDLSSQCAYVLHKRTLEVVGGDWAEAMAFRGPDIIVCQVYRPPGKGESTWQPTGMFEVIYDSEKVDDFLIDENMIGKRIIQEDAKAVA